MKISFSPKKETVLALLQLKIDTASDGLANAEKEVARVREGKGVLYHPGEEAEWLRTKGYYEEDLRKLTDLRSLLESHANPHVSAETEV